ncbi:MAG: bifunctional diguanylate cyclase/phosphodiesterase [Steroidobacteraceae bacterium]
MSGTRGDAERPGAEERSAERLRRDLALQGGCNRLLVNAKDETSLIEGICRLLVAEGGYRFAWVGFAQDDDARSVTPVASAGLGAAYLKLAHITWADTPMGRGPTGRAIRGRRAELCRSIESDPLFQPWQRDALTFQYQSSIALPLLAGDICLGALNAYADRADVFDPPETELLTELSLDLAYGIGALRARTERQQAREQAELFHTLLQQCNDMIYVVDADSGRVLDANESGAERLGYTREELLSLSVSEFAPAAAEPSWPERADYIKAVGTLVTEAPYRTRGGSTFPVEASLRYLEHEGKRYIVAVARDITEHRRHREQLERLARILRMQSGVNAAVLRIEDRDELLQEACRLATAVGGYDRAVMAVVDASGRKAVPRFRAGSALDFPEPAELELGDGSAPDANLVSRALRTGQASVSSDLSYPEPPTAMRETLVERGYRAMVALPLVAEGRREAALVLVSRNPDLVADGELLILLQEMMETLSFALRSRLHAETVQFLAYYDPLTGLAKRTRFAERLDELVRHDDAQTAFAVVAFDVRGLNRINDTFGRHVGDSILREVADRLRLHGRGEELAAYLGGGAFAIVEPPLAGDESIRSVLNANLFAEPAVIEGQSLLLSASYGVAHFPQDGADGATLLQRAEAALKLAKDSGTSYLHYRLEMHSEIAERLRLEHKLSTALAAGQFDLHYQAELDPATGRIDAVEALLRWNDPDSGIVAPGRFLHVLEATGLILPVGDWVLTRAVEDCERWSRLGIAPLRVGVNVSAVQLRQRAFLGKVLELAARLVRSSGFGLDLEITESTLLQDPDGAGRMLRELRAAGIRIALDDFGTGYSSLGLLSKLPVDVLKIDHSFTRGIPHDAPSVAIVDTVLRLASAFHLKTVVEGVETAAQLEAVRAMRCDRWQGYLHGPPVPAHVIERELPRA